MARSNNRGPCIIHCSPQSESRKINVEVLSLPQDGQVLLGQIPVETLDFWIDIVNQRLVGNPEHGGHWMAEVH